MNVNVSPRQLADANGTIVRAIVGIARGASLTVIAECVETATQARNVAH